MRNLGQVLRTYREKQHYSVEQLSQETQVPSDVITALEDEHFDQLPAAALVKGYIQLLAETLRIPEETALALWRRDVPTPNGSQLLSSSEQRPLGRRQWWQPRTLTVVGGLVAFVLAIIVLVWQWRQIGKPPTLAVDDLENYATLKDPIVISGQTDPNTTLTINTELVGLDQEGKFQYQLDLPPGQRTLVIDAIDAQGRKAEKIFFVTVE